ncbi:raffinose/stachyose/melibiose transport system permease protein [Clostridium cavendishii DSM 21758]|uniref:Raffinose/stachyose/melibiose transport system permease protein n=1 Tax=Clostridium cavendishii DSM 21758 TaxID=1121302 RepID=A0A1M6UFH1_9CLOT|nr:carbohydrate ABC transporter permease [Clostridium cavendishii]SHK68015.1 raffinose/stachyose/melibiose transport system permease protein [Clostridium cavendishii DSM 21758]
MEQKKRRSKLKFNNIVLGIFGILLALLFLSPFYIIFINSFKSKRELFESTLYFPAIWTTDNYKSAFERLQFFKTLGISIFVTATSVVVIIIFTSMAAWVLERNNGKTSTITFYMFIAAMLIPFQAVMLPLVRIMGKLNLLNIGGLIFMYLGFGSSLSIFLYHGFLKSIPRELEDAAMIDGCSKFKTFWYIIFPLLKPTTITVAILNVVWIWNDFLLPSLVINKPATQTIPLKTFFFFGEYTKQWNFALAGLVLTIIPVIVFYFLAQKHIIKSITAGSIKS